jgi:hypothetical protein
MEADNDAGAVLDHGLVSIEDEGPPSVAAPPRSLLMG